MIHNDDIHRIRRQDNIARETRWSELLDTLGHDDSAGAPVVCAYINTHVVQMVRSAQEQCKHTPANARYTSSRAGIRTSEQEMARVNRSYRIDEWEPTCSNLDLLHCCHRLGRLCCHQHHVPTPEILNAHWMVTHDVLNISKLNLEPDV